MKYLKTQNAPDVKLCSEQAWRLTLASKVWIGPEIHLNFDTSNGADADAKCECSGRSRISPRWGHQLPRVGTNIRFCQNFPKTAWIWKNLDPWWGGRPKFYYVDRPLEWCNGNQRIPSTLQHKRQSEYKAYIWCENSFILASFFKIDMCPLMFVFQKYSHPPQSSYIL